MIREKKTKREESGGAAFLTVVLLSVGIIFLSSLVGYIENRFGIERLENIIYLILIVVAYILIRKYLTEYRYSFFDDELIVEKILGKKITQVAIIKTREITYFGKLADTDWNDKEMHVDYCDVRKRNAYCIKYLREGAARALTMNPSEELIMHIQKALETRDFDELDEEKLIK